MLLRFFRRLFFIALVMALLACLLGALVIERSPTVQKAKPPTPEDVVKARRFVRGVRTAVDPGADTEAVFVADEAQLNAVLKLGTRMIPGLRGTLSLEGGTASVLVSIPVPRTRKKLWINAYAVAPEFEGTFGLSELTVGALNLPPQLSLDVARLAANAIVGDDFGDTALSAATRMEIERDTATFALAMDDIGSNGLMRGIFGTLRGSEMPGPGEVERYYRLIRKAMDRGDLPVSGSYLPYLQFTLQAAYDGRGKDGLENAFTSAILALGRACGARDFTLIVGGLFEDTFAEDASWKTSCKDLTLNGRIDSRRHFTTAAAIQAASNRGFSISVGEFKELLDTVKSGGFDFTDIAANNSGIRMSNTLMAASEAAWPAILARIRNEADVIVSFDGIPPIMSGQDFEDTYGTVESQAYRDRLAAIEARIDKLPLHAR